MDLAGVSFMSRSPPKAVCDLCRWQGSDGVWQRCAVGRGKVCAGKPTKISLAKAKEMGAAMTPAWHLPTKEEMVSVVVISRRK